MLSFAGLPVLVSLTHHPSLPLSPSPFNSSFNFFVSFLPLYISTTSPLLPFLLRLSLIPLPFFIYFHHRRSLCYQIFQPYTPVLGHIPTGKKMNHCGIHQNKTFASSCEEMRGSVSVSVTFDNGEPMVCPKPRRLSLFNNEPVRHLRWQMCYQSEGYESKAGPELLDIIFAKGGGYGGSEATCAQVASSPPFFSGSPPSRVSNPLIQDARFGDGKTSPVSPRAIIPNPGSSGMSSASSSSSSARKGGCLRANFGNKPAVRVEGFDCLDRDNRRNCSIPALA